MQRAKCITPIFYVRGFNAPYTEGHIQVVRNIVRSLSLGNMKSVIFNNKYQIKEATPDNNFHANKFEQKIPLINRDEILHVRRKSIVAYTSLMETLATLKFLSIEESIKNKHDRFILNIINCFRYPRVFVKRFFTLPIVLHLYMRSTISETITKILLDKTDMIIASSKTVAHHVKKTCNVSESKIETMYPPVDTKLYKPIDKSQGRKRLGLPKEAKVILYIGNLIACRFPEEIVLQTLNSLVKETPETKLLVFAPRSSENVTRTREILAKIKKTDLTANVKIVVKNLSDEEKSMIYRGSDVFLFPALEPTKAIEPPLTILEAMASGLPVVSNDTSSVREIITDEVNGLIVPFKNEGHSRLAEKISLLLRNKETITNLSFNARQTIVKKASFVNSCKKLIGIYSQLAL